MRMKILGMTLLSIFISSFSWADDGSNRLPPKTSNTDQLEVPVVKVEPKNLQNASCTNKPSCGPHMNLILPPREIQCWGIADVSGPCYACEFQNIEDAEQDMQGACTQCGSQILGRSGLVAGFGRESVICSRPR